MYVKKIKYIKRKKKQEIISDERIQWKCNKIKFKHNDEWKVKKKNKTNKKKTLKKKNTKQRDEQKFQGKI